MASLHRNVIYYFAKLSLRIHISSPLTPETHTQDYGLYKWISRRKSEALFIEYKSSHQRASINNRAGSWALS